MNVFMGGPRILRLLINLYIGKYLQLNATGVIF